MFLKMVLLKLGDIRKMAYWGSLNIKITLKNLFGTKKQPIWDFKISGGKLAGGRQRAVLVGSIVLFSLDIVYLICGV